MGFDAADSIDVDGDIVRYDWDFDGDLQWDSYDAPAQVSHAYTAPGVFTARLRVTDDAGAQDIATLDISINAVENDMPTALIQADPTGGDAPVTVAFDGLGSSDADGLIARYDWDFDGDLIWDAYDAPGEVEHSYGAPGAYTARLRVSDDAGAQDLDSLEINVNAAGNDPPAADLQVSPEYGDAGLTADLDASASADADGEIVKYEWDFNGDGQYDSYGSTPLATHSYNNFGLFAPKLRVTDDSGAQATATAELRVNEVFDLDSAWPGFGHDPRGTRRSPYIGAQTSALKWSYLADDDILTCPAIGADGTIYFGSRDKNLYALDPDGGLKWSYTTAWYITSSPAIGPDGTIYVGSYDNNLYAINPDGSLKWTYGAAAVISRGPSVGPDGTIYFGTRDTSEHDLIALNPDGTLRWSYPASDRLDSGQAIAADGTVYFGIYSGKLYALNPDGSLKWIYTAGNLTLTSPAIGTDGTVYVGSYDNKLHAVSPSGELRWTYLTAADIHSSPAIAADGTIYFGSDDNKLFALNPDGSLKWSYAAPDRVFSSPAIGADGVVYFGCEDKSFYAVNSDGTLKWSYATGDVIYGHPSIGADGTVYVGTDGDRLFAFGQP